MLTFDRRFTGTTAHADWKVGDTDLVVDQDAAKKAVFRYLTCVSSVSWTPIRAC